MTATDRADNGNGESSRIETLLEETSALLPRLSGLGVAELRAFLRDLQYLTELANGGGVRTELTPPPHGE